MAKVEYNAAIYEMTGSVSGTTFQRNNSGTIVKKKSANIKLGSFKQVSQRLAMNYLVKLWHSLSYSNKVLWETFASSYTRYSYWNKEKTLTGFNWFTSINSNRLSCGASYTATPPSYVTPLFCPVFKTLALNDGLFIQFENFPTAHGYYLLIFATPPLRQLNSQSRKSLRLIKVIEADQILSHDLTSDYEDYFGFSWPMSGSEGDWNVLIACSCVDSSTFISGQFYLSSSPIDLTFSSASFGNSFSTVNTMPVGLLTRGVNYVSDGICLSFGMGGAGLYRSSDYGLTWSFQYTFPASTIMYDADTDSAGVVCAACASSANIYRSTDYGQTWSLVYNAATESSIFSILYLGNSIWIAGTGNGALILRSVDNGVTWGSVGSVGTGTQVQSMAIGKNGRIVCVISSTGESYYSDDQGATWSASGNLSGITNIYSVIYLGNSLFICSVLESGDIWSSSDNGLTWAYLSNPGTTTRSVCLASFLPGMVFLGSWNSGIIYKSVNNGTSWSSLGTILSQSRVYSLAIAFFKGLLCGTFNSSLTGLDETGIE